MVFIGYIGQYLGAVKFTTDHWALKIGTCSMDKRAEM